jgi:hypothetical protein
MPKQDVIFLTSSRFFNSDCYHLVLELDNKRRFFTRLLFGASSGCEKGACGHVPEVSADQSGFQPSSCTNSRLVSGAGGQDLRLRLRKCTSTWSIWHIRESAAGSPY